ncbi:GTPase-activator protein for Ras family GTPase [Balamuthia mandrillaris]
MQEAEDVVLSLGISTNGESCAKLYRSKTPPPASPSHKEKRILASPTKRNSAVRLATKVTQRRKHQKANESNDLEDKANSSIGEEKQTVISNERNDVPKEEDARAKLTNGGRFCTDVNVVRAVLLRSRMQLVTQLCRRTDAEEVSVLAKLLVTVFEHNGYIMQLMEWAIGYEVSASVDPDTLLREDSLPNQLLAQYFVLVGADYLRSTLRGEIAKVLRSPPNSDRKVRDAASSFLKEICNSVAICPPEITYLCHMLGKTINQRFSWYNTSSVVGSFFMLRFICPALVSPDRIGFIEDQAGKQLASEVYRGLVAVAKLLQALANPDEIQQQTEQQVLSKWDQFLNSKKPNYTQFITAIISMSPRLMKGEHFASSHTLVSKEEEVAALKLLQELVIATDQREREKNEERTTAKLNSCSSSASSSLPYAAAETIFIYEETEDKEVGEGDQQHTDEKQENKSLVSGCVVLPERYKSVFSNAEKAVLYCYKRLKQDRQQSIILFSNNRKEKNPTSPAKMSPTPEEQATTSQTVSSTKLSPVGQERSSPAFVRERFLLLSDSLSDILFGVLRGYFSAAPSAALKTTVSLEEVSAQIASDLLYDIAHSIGKNDSRMFRGGMGLDTPAFNLAVGMTNIATMGWGRVHILPESNLDQRDNNFFILGRFEHSFEAHCKTNGVDNVLEGDVRKSNRQPVCIMTGGYLSGWCEESLGVELLSAEIRCRRRGDGECCFIIAPPNMIKQHIKAILFPIDEDGIIVPSEEEDVDGKMDGAETERMDMENTELPCSSKNERRFSSPLCQRISRLFINSLHGPDVVTNKGGTISSLSHLDRSRYLTSILPSGSSFVSSSSSSSSSSQESIRKLFSDVRHHHSSGTLLLSNGNDRAILVRSKAFSLGIFAVLQALLKDFGTPAAFSKNTLSTNNSIQVQSTIAENKTEAEVDETNVHAGETRGVGKRGIGKKQEKSMMK